MEKNPKKGGLGGKKERKKEKEEKTRRDQGGMPQPDRASLLASAGGARDTHAARETTADGASFSHIACYSTKGAFHTK